MDSIEPPSFSLGFDLDAASDPQSVSYQKNPSSSVYDQQEPGITISDSDREFEPAFSSPPVLKRLRRGIDTDKCSAKDDRRVVSEVLDCKDNRDDDIEEFSSPEDFPTGNCILSFAFSFPMYLCEMGSHCNVDEVISLFTRWVYVRISFNFAGEKGGNLGFSDRRYIDIA